MLSRLFPRYARTLILRIRREEQGIGIVFAIFVSALVFILGAGWTQIATHQVGQTGFQRNRAQAIDAAEAGIYRAITLLSADPTVATVTLTSLDQGTTKYGEYEVTIATDPLDPNGRLITSTGYGPEQGSDLEAARTLEAEVVLVPDDGFDFTLFASETTAAGFGGDAVDLGTSAVVQGDIFAGGTVEWEGSASSITGNVSAWDRIKSEGSVSGDLTSAGEEVCPGSGGSCNVWVKTGTVTGDVYSADDPSTAGVEGYVDIGWPSGGTAPRVTGGVYTEIPAATPGIRTSGAASPAYGTDGQGIPVIPPPKRLLPTFAWDSGDDPDWNHLDENFGGVSTSHTSPAAWTTYFQSNYVTGISGAHDVTDGSGDVTLGGSYTVGVCPLCTPVNIASFEITGDTTIYTDEPIKFQADVTNTLGTHANLVIISTYTGGNAVEFTTGVSIDSDVDLLVYAPGNAVTFDGSADVIPGGVVYAKSITESNSLNITEADFSDVGGFTWPSVDYAPVQIINFREVPTP